MAYSKTCAVFFLVLIVGGLSSPVVDSSHLDKRQLSQIFGPFQVLYELLFKSAPSLMAMIKDFLQVMQQLQSLSAAAGPAAGSPPTDSGAGSAPSFFFKRQDGGFPGLIQNFNAGNLMDMMFKIFESVFSMVKQIAQTINGQSSGAGGLGSGISSFGTGSFFNRAAPSSQVTPVSVNQSLSLIQKFFASVISFLSSLQTQVATTGSQITQANPGRALVIQLEFNRLNEAIEFLLRTATAAQALLEKYQTVLTTSIAEEQAPQENEVDTVGGVPQGRKLGRRQAGIDYAEFQTILDSISTDIQQAIDHLTKPLYESAKPFLVFMCSLIEKVVANVPWCVDVQGGGNSTSSTQAPPSPAQQPAAGARLY